MRTNTYSVRHLNHAYVSVTALSWLWRLCAKSGTATDCNVKCLFVLMFTFCLLYMCLYYICVCTIYVFADYSLNTIDCVWQLKSPQSIFLYKMEENNKPYGCKNHVT